MRRLRSSLVVAALTTLGAGPALAGPAWLAEPAASAALQRLSAVDLEGRRWTADSLRGRVVLIDFWATWCAPCLAEMPRLKALRSRHHRRDFEILGISVDATSRPALVSWLNRNRIEWPQVHERSGYSGPTVRLFGIESLPRTILIDRDGTVVARDVRGETLVALVDDLVAAAPGSGGARR